MDFFFLLYSFVGRRFVLPESLATSAYNFFLSFFFACQVKDFHLFTEWKHFIWHVCVACITNLVLW